ncbi:Flavinator of succinate dehydrogenase-domain-containing protein [Nemania serpens]|nr:Flavinator of succinate dehydrogenase-domain-containing protein [Nemania serpens]
MASFQRSLIGPARRALALARSNTSKASAPRILARSMATVGNTPPMEPQKQRPHEMAVGEFEGAGFTIEPLRRVGEDDKTMRARLVYQSRKRGILETDLLLSTFADARLPAMTREQMAEYDLFLDENDWDIYYWATQEEPSSASSSSTSTTKTTTTTTDTSSPSYGSGPETESATADPSTASSSSSSSPSAPSTTSTGGLPLSGEHGDAKAELPISTTASTSTSTTTGTSSPPTPSPSPYAGEWAQTIGTFKPAYRPVPARWRDSGILSLLRTHVRARAGEKGGMAFMPALRS